MYFRGLFSDNKTKLVYSNGLSQVHLSSPFSDGSNRTAYKNMFKIINTGTKTLRLAEESAAANIVELK